jgi:hypothetical protein
LTAQSRQTELAELRSQFVAPDVVATWSLAAFGPGHDKLQLLVLWRGTPGWGRRTGSFGTRGQAVGSPEECQGGGPRSFRRQILVGNLTFDVGLDLQSRLVPDNQEFDMRSSNVFLIDRVDDSSTPRGVQPMWSLDESDTVTLTANPVPEPASLLLLGTGSLSLIAAMRRRKQQS